MSSDEIRPFTIAVADEEIADLKDRLHRTRWPEAETVDDWSQGFPLSYAQDVCAYWADGYDWRRCEADLNSRSSFVTELGGLDIHFQHIRSPHADATPLIITHGWPGSIVEFQKIIEPLTDPTAHGGEERDAFHLVLPSLPGYGWSAKPTNTGTGVSRIATLWDELMERLGLRQLRRPGRRLGVGNHNSDRFAESRPLPSDPHQPRVRRPDGRLT